MMTEPLAMIIASLLSACVAIVVATVQHNKTIALVEYRLKQLEDKVNKHNNLVERMYKVEETASLNCERIKVANHRIDDLENK